MGNCLLSDTNTLDMDDYSDLIPTYSSSSSSPHSSAVGSEWDVFNMRPGGRGCVAGGSVAVGGGGADGLLASSSGVVSSRAGK